MAEILGFEIKNFRGAKDISIKLTSKARLPVTTLVGLNESGKTTILEALSQFASRDITLDRMMTPGRRRDLISFLPIELKPAFTGLVSVTADVLVTDDDKKSLMSAYALKGIELDQQSISKNITISVRYAFKNSAYDEEDSGTYWYGIDWKYKKKNGKVVRKLSADSEDEKKIWQIAVSALQETLPQVVYFPTFLVDLPKKVYLEPHQGETSTNSYYRTIISNILGDLPNKLNLEDHVLGRIRSFKVKDASPTWIAKIFGSPEKGLIDSVFNKAGALVTRRVLEAWREVIGGSINIENIALEWGLDPAKADLPYVTFSASDGESKYELDERSLGFRWFFSFLLFTTFGGAAKRRKLFLFDEPAANLHVKAQSQLLDSFRYLLSRGDYIIYSTHSAHMIEVDWLSGAVIVENDAIDYDRDVGESDFSVVPTNIKVTPYRQFVQRYPARTSYFQPIAEKLEHVAPAVLPDRPALIVEGPSDFYALKYVAASEKLKLPFDIVPAESADKFAPLIGLYLGRGIRFFVLLDDDKAGRDARDRYREHWFISDAEVGTFGDLDASLGGKMLEGLLSADSKAKIQAHFGTGGQPAPKLTKKLIAAYFAEAATAASKGWLSVETVNTLKALLASAKSKLS
ncbi:AAA family ATPase [Devosia sp. CN2-171]|uniref:AAA family ATPase n=1 Tax=Devosia sp. CN2-171 TaxID=3400909 RepID=UPI003BF8D125